MSKSNLYTGTGDSGTTSLVGGVRIRKDSPRLDAYGTVDEFSCFLGVLAASSDCTPEAREQIYSIQNFLFDIGAYLATEVKPGTQPLVSGLDDTQIAIIEGWIDDLDTATPQIKAFVLPGGTSLAAATHVARAVCRRAERKILLLAKNEFVDPKLLTYMNRLSDYLFILARNFNFLAGVPEVTWKK